MAYPVGVVRAGSHQHDAGRPGERVQQAIDELGMGKVVHGEGELVTVGRGVAGAGGREPGIGRSKPLRGRTAPDVRRSFTVAPAARTPARLARSQLISCTVAPAARASSPASWSTGPGRPASSRSGRSPAGRFAIALVAGCPRPAVGPVIRTVPELISLIAAHHATAGALVRPGDQCRGHAFTSPARRRLRRTCQWARPCRSWPSGRCSGR